MHFRHHLARRSYRPRARDRPCDEAEFVQAFERMSDDARYMRMMHVVREPNLERVRAVLASFPKDGIGIVATIPATDGYDIVGSAVAIFAKDPVRCEFAISVDAAYGGAGLATALMTALMDEAGRHGMEVMEGFVLSRTSRCFAWQGAWGSPSSSTPTTAPCASAAWRWTSRRGQEPEGRAAGSS